MVTYWFDFLVISPMVSYCKFHNEPPHYQPYFYKRNDEEFSNIALTLIHQTNKMMESYFAKLENFFIQNAGIKEAMTKARKQRKSMP